jgi:hypothetical protein
MHAARGHGLRVGGACRLANPCCRFHLCSLGEGPARESQERPPLPGGRSWMCAAREPVTALPAAPPLRAAASSHGGSLPVCPAGRHRGTRRP